MHRAPWIAEELAERGHAVADGWLGRERASPILAALQLLHDQGQFMRAGVGVERVVNHEIRGDETAWLDGENTPAAILPLLVSLEELRASLARSLMLPLVEIECHAARYPVHSGYAPHIDDLKGAMGRRVSFAWYCNEEWLDEDGGALRLHIDEPKDVLPVLDRMVLFRSDAIRHEVLSARRIRWSVTGWMRLRRALGAGLPLGSGR
jgi:SM-20-related protein